MVSWSNHSEGRRQQAERLESRKLLSSAGGLDDSESVDTPAGAVTVQVVEVLELHAVDMEEDEEEVSIDPSELPVEIREAFESAYPGAQIVEIEVEQEDNEAEYDIVARQDGVTLEVGLDSDGEILEVVQLLDESELPQEITDWIHANFDEPDVLEIELVNEDGQVSYELEIIGDDGPPMEVALRLDQVVVEPGTQQGVVILEPTFVAAAASSPQEPEVELPAAVATAAVAEPADEADATPAQATPKLEATAPPGEEGGLSEPGLLPHGTPVARESIQEQAAGFVESAVMLPDLLLGAVRIDLGRIDAQLEQLLAEIDRIVQTISRPDSWGMEMRFALLLALIAGAQILRSKSVRRPVSSVFMQSDRSSAWSLWSATTIQK